MSNPRAPIVSVVMPVHNVEKFVAQAMQSVLAQTFTDFELIIVDDGGQDGSVAICESLADHRTRIISQQNRGLAGARNTGIAAARGEFVALIDSDDAWTPDKLAAHVAHLRSDPSIGASYAAAALIGEDGRELGIRQQPRLGRAGPREVFTGQAIKNGSIPVFRRAALEDAALRPEGTDRVWYFDETLRRSEDVECWTRMALTTGWVFAGIRGCYTLYRINGGGLSADVIRQLESWERVAASIAAYAPDFIAAHGREARARELRYLARRCFQMRDRGLAAGLALEASRTWPMLLVREPIKTLTTFAACALLRVLPERPFGAMARILRAPGT
jgi:glycosyltransferase involved in cell wall biosynthesis